MISTAGDLERLAQEVVTRQAEHGGVQGAMEARGIDWETFAKYAAKAVATSEVFLEDEEDLRSVSQALFVTGFELGLQAGYRGDE